MPFTLKIVNDLRKIKQTRQEKVVHIVVKGVRNRPPQDVPLWHVHYFELQAIETL